MVIMVPVLERGLLRAGFFKNMPRAVFYGEVEHQDLGLHNVYPIMVIRTIQAGLYTTWKDSIIGKLVFISMELFKLELEMQRSISELNYKTFGYLGTDCWIKYLWKFTQENLIKIGDNMKGGGIIKEER